MKQSTSAFVKKAGAATMAIAVTAAMCPALALASAGDDGATATATKMTAQTKKKTSKNMKARGAKFDLKKGKWKKFKRVVKGTKSKLSYKGRVKSVKISNAKKAGYKKARFVIEVKLAKTPSKALQSKIAEAYYKWSPRYGYVDPVSVYGYWLIDYATGENLERDNSKNVTVKGGWLEKSSRYTKKYRYKTAWAKLEKYSKAVVTVTYPKSYKGLCVCVGGPLASGVNVPFLDPVEQVFGSEYWYEEDANSFKRDVNNYHFMRVK